MMIKSKIRTLSGVTPVAFLVKPYPCPGKCIYCPTEKGMPQSYLSNEPAVMRAITNDFDPIRQIRQRLKMYETGGHSIDKIEIIIIGGTWSYYPINYQKKVIWSVYYALNNYQEPEVRRQELGKKNITNKDIEIEKRKNETAKCRCVGMSIETRPDFINIEEIKRLRDYGVTRVELGVQTVDEKILKLIKRGHGRKEIIQATALLKNAGFKVCYHLMPNLPGSTPESDYLMFKEIFSNPDFCPDQLKIYPCVLAGECELKNWFKDGRWRPYSDKELIDLLAKIKSEIIPRYVRIMRLWRDIPSTEIEAGSKMSHIRQVIRKHLTCLAARQAFNSKQCRCVRCREIFDNPQEENLILKRTDYQASNGKEIFLEYIDSQDRIYGLLRLRISDSPALSLLKDAGIIRELHIFGQSVGLDNSNYIIPDEIPIKSGPRSGIPALPAGRYKNDRMSSQTAKSRSGIYSNNYIDSGLPAGRQALAGMTKENKVQHHGLGKKLMTEAERIIKNEFKLPKIAVIAGIGVREYYRQLGYRLKDEYMVKQL